MSHSASFSVISCASILSALSLLGCGNSPPEEVANDRYEQDRGKPTLAVGAGLIEGRYNIRADDGGEIVFDAATGLEWQRCSLGQSWDGGACAGNASRYNLDGALTAARDLNDGGGLGGYTDWRVPSHEELRTLVYCASGQPAYFKNDNAHCVGSLGETAIVSKAFPNTPGLSYWAASTVAENSSNAWFVDFGTGGSAYFDRGARLRVRLVRGGE